jgi:hypothetical protein
MCPLSKYKQHTQANTQPIQFRLHCEDSEKFSVRASSLLYRFYTEAGLTAKVGQNLFLPHFITGLSLYDLV